MHFETQKLPYVECSLNGTQRTQSDRYLLNQRVFILNSKDIGQSNERLWLCHEEAH